MVSVRPQQAADRAQTRGVRSPDGIRTHSTWGGEVGNWVEGRRKSWKSPVSRGEGISL